jgi:uncharacterized protein YndB with AHSA1/START domain
MKGIHTCHKVYINCSAEKVFHYLTTGSCWDKWFTQGTVVNLTKEPYFIKFVWKNFGIDKVSFEDGGPILKAIPNKQFTFNWFPIDDHTPITVNFALSEINESTIVEVTDSGYRMENKHLAQLVDCAQGWTEAMTLLKFYLEHKITYGHIPSKD